MKQIFFFLALLCIPVMLSGCKKQSNEPDTTVYTIEVILQNTPFRTNEFLRIPYSLKTWEWKKSGYVLKQINVLDDISKTVIGTLDSLNIPKIYMDPLPPNPIVTWDKLCNYYLSLQVPIPVSQEPPLRISHRLVFSDTVHNTLVNLEGGVFSPDYSDIPISISSPVKGTRWMFYNQSTNEYHFYVLIFTGGQIGNGERFAFDNSQTDENFDKFYAGDPGMNDSYFCYGDTLYAIANGTVTACSDTMTENDGNQHNHQDFHLPIDFSGNYLILNIGNGKYAMYAHCKRYSMMVNAGDTISEGQPLALLGNSGNSDAPHLHFEIGDAPDFFMCNGIPFVLKKFTMIGTYKDPTPIPPVDYFNTMNEQVVVMSFD